MQKSLLTSFAAATLTAALVLAPSTATAQSASISATATVATALTVSNLRDLDFGTVIPGFSRTILETDATSGHFLVAGGANAEVAISFSSLPASLSGPGAPLAVTYGSTHNTSDAGGSGTSFVPGGGLTTRLDAASGELHIYIGGVLVVPGGQLAGAYSATITMDAAYTGN